MKLGSFGAVLFILVFALPALALAHGHHRNPVGPPHAPTPPPVSPPPSGGGVSGTNCINAGYSENGQVNFALLKSYGFTCVRLAFEGQNNPASESLALAAKSAGFYVVLGNDGDPSSAGYNSGVVAEAQWAQSHGIDEVAIGNEDAKNAATQGELASLSCQVRDVYQGVISYSTYLADPGGFDDIKAWAANPGCLTRLGLNVYASWASTFAEAQQYLPGKWYASEIGPDCTNTVNCTNDAVRAAYIKQNILPALAGYSVQAFWFAFDSGGDGVQTYWAMQNEPLTLAEI
jgi:hypothetical protein